MMEDRGLLFVECLFKSHIRDFTPSVIMVKIVRNHPNFGIHQHFLIDLLRHRDGFVCRGS